MSGKEIDERVVAVTTMLGFEPYLGRKPTEISGGQQKRVEIARAMTKTPDVFLFDEPLSNLDAALRVGMRMEISSLHKKLQTTMVYVTHDQVEAMTMADKIVVFKDGVIEQVGTPIELYREPKNLFVAGFIGSPKMNFIGGSEAQKFGVSIIGIRPEHLSLSKESGDWSGRVSVSEHLGSDTFLHVTVDGFEAPVTVRVNGDVDVHYGDAVFVTPNREAIHKFGQDGVRLK